MPMSAGRLPFSIFSLDHRPELQGVRAFAVIAVVFYHLEGTVLPGGFVGVDVFFVVSGFLIGRKLLAELDERGTLDVWRFAAARAKRLLPNALLTLLVAGGAAAALLPAHRLADIGTDARASALVHANFHFAADAVDYLRIGEPPGPFLHFWSLSVEEQVYLGLPLVLLITALLPRHRRVPAAILLVSLVAVASFASGLWALQTSRPDAFFRTENRVWQLALGVVCGWASVVLVPRLARTVATALLAPAAAVVVASLFLLSADAPYPGYRALPPTLATAAFLMVLARSGDTAVHRALSHPVARWIGDRSYSLYLWHWPAIAIAAELYPESRLAVWTAGLLSFVAAAFAYGAVEEPVRRRPLGSKRATLAAAVGAAGIVAAAATGLAYLPMPPDAAMRAARIETARADLGGAYETGCHLGLTAISGDACAFGPTDGRRIVLFGDSHAAQWFPPIHDAAIEAGWQFVARTKSSCPAPDVTIWYPPRTAIYEACGVWRARVMAEIRADPPAVVVLANYSGYSGWIAEDGRPVSDARAAQLWGEAFERLLDDIPTTSAIWVLRDNPRMFNDYLACLSRSDDCRRPRRSALARLTDDADLAGRSGRHVAIVDFTDRLCDAAACPAVINGAIVYRDHHHLTAAFTRSLAPTFAELIGATLAE